MNDLGVTCVWCALQVSIFALAGSAIYAVRRRWGPRAASLVPLTSLVMIAALTALAFCPWQGWWNVLPSAAARIAQSSAEPASSPMAKSLPFERTRPESGSDQAVNPASSAREPTGISAAELWQLFLRELDNVRAERAGMSWRWPAVWAGVVLFCAALGMLRLAAGLVAVRKYRCDSRPIEDARLVRMKESLRAQLGCRQTIELRESPALSTAATVG
jgi:hypothetical protein